MFVIEGKVLAKSEFVLGSLSIVVGHCVTFFCRNILIDTLFEREEVLPVASFLRVCVWCILFSPVSVVQGQSFSGSLESAIMCCICCVWYLKERNESFFFSKEITKPESFYRNCMPRPDGDHLESYLLKHWITASGRQIYTMGAWVLFFPSYGGIAEVARGCRKVAKGLVGLSLVLVILWSYFFPPLVVKAETFQLCLSWTSLVRGMPGAHPYFVENHWKRAPSPWALFYLVSDSLNIRTVTRYSKHCHGLLSFTAPDVLFVSAFAK